MSESKKLSKAQQRSAASLFIEGVSVPMLILSTTVLFSAVSIFITPISIFGIIAIIVSAMAIIITKNNHTISPYRESGLGSRNFKKVNGSVYAYCSSAMFKT